MSQTDSSKVILLICSFIFFFTSHSLFAQEGASAEKKFRPLRIDQDFDINGDLSSELWSKAEPVYIEHEILPDDQALAPVKTTVKVLYSEKYLYVGFWCDDPNPGKIRAHLSDRDDSFSDDFVGLLLDPFNNNKHGYEVFYQPVRNPDGWDANGR